MSRFKCAHCLQKEGDVRLVEHGTDDIPLCKSCFKSIRREFDNRVE